MNRSNDKPPAPLPPDVDADSAGALPEAADEAIVDHDPTLRWVLSDYDAPMNVTPPPVNPDATGRFTPPLQPVPIEWSAPALPSASLAPPLPAAAVTPPRAAMTPTAEVAIATDFSSPPTEAAYDPAAHIPTPPPVLRDAPVGIPNSHVAAALENTPPPISAAPQQSIGASPTSGARPAELFGAQETPPSPTEIIASIAAGAAPAAEHTTASSESDLSVDVEEAVHAEGGARPAIVVEASSGSTMPNDVLDDDAGEGSAAPAASPVETVVAVAPPTEPHEVEPEAVEMLESAEHLTVQEERPLAGGPPPTPPPVPVEAALHAPPPAPAFIAAALFDELQTPTSSEAVPEALARRSLKKRSKPWYEEVFDEDFLRTLPFTTPEQTAREIAFIRQSLAPPKDAEILDVGCGYGRHALELAQHGFKLTGLDLSLPMLIRAADHAQKRGLTVNFVHADMREMAFNSQFDGAYCMLSSFGYFDEETNLRVASSICKALKPGGRFLLDIINRDYIVGDLPSRVWWEGEGCVVLEEVDFNYHTSRVLIRRSVVFGNGRQTEQEISLRAYSLHEVGKLLRHAGLRVLDVSGSLATKSRFFGAASRSIIALCERPAG